MAKGTVEIIDIGNYVCCDACGTDYSESKETGGFLFAGRAICPVCQPEWEKNAEKYKETHLIQAYCRPTQTFKDFCLAIRQGNNTVKIISF